MGIEVHGVFAYIKKSNNLDEVLMIRRRDRPYVGTLSLPGGEIEKNETHRQALVRELSEELLKIKCKFGKYIGWVKFPDDKDKRIRYSANVYDALYISGNPQTGDQISEVRWLKEEDIIKSDVALPVSEFYKKMQSATYFPIGLTIEE